MADELLSVPQALAVGAWLGFLGGILAAGLVRFLDDQEGRP